MNSDATALLIPRIAVVDDERQVHASIRLRLGRDYELVSFYDPREAIEAVGDGKFDLCIVDIHMPHMDGLAFVETVAKRDSALGCVMLSAFDTDENLRRTIPLHVYDFIPKPLPERPGFEARLPEWIERTRRRRRDLALAQQAGVIDRELEAARLEREIEIVASESARDALQQTANPLTTIHAHLVSAATTVAARAKNDPGLAPLARSLEVARQTADAAATVAEGFFDSNYGSRDTAPALIDAGLQHAIGIARRIHGGDEMTKEVDCAPIDHVTPVRGLSGIDFLLMMVPAVGLALTVSPPHSTVRIHGGPLARLDLLLRYPRAKAHLWLNRRQALGGRPGVHLSFTASAPPLARTQAEAWLRGEDPLAGRIAPRGLVRGTAKCQSLLGLGVAPSASQFQLDLALPV